MRRTTTSNYLELSSCCALALLLSASCYVKPGTLDLPCTVDSECDAGQFCVLGTCASSPGVTDSDAAATNATTTAPSTSSGSTSGSTTAGAGMTTATSTGVETTMSVEPTTIGTTGMGCPDDQVLEEGVCVFPSCEARVCGEVSSEWLIQINSPADAGQNINAIAVSDETLYAVGWAHGVTEFTPGGAHGWDDERMLYLAAYRLADGEFEWIKTFRLGLGDQASAIRSVDFDKNTQKIAIAGVLDSPVDLNPDPVDEMQVMNEGQDGFVAQFTAEGEYQWHRSFQSSGFENANAVAYGNTDSLYVAGEYTQSFAEDPLELPATTLGFENVYVARVAKIDGALTALAGFGDEASKLRVNDLSVGANNSVTWVGSYTQSFALADGVDTPNAGGAPAPVLVGVGGQALTYSNFSATPGAGGISQAFFGVASTQSKIYVTGLFEGALDFGMGVVMEEGQGDIMLAAYDLPALSWAKTFGDGQSQLGKSVATSEGGDRLLFSGSCGGALDFGGGELTALGEVDGCFAMFDDQGQHLWSVLLGGDDDPGPPPAEAGNDVALMDDGTALINGSFTGELTLGGVPMAEAPDDQVHYIMALSGG